ncbi:hypothetical protein GQ42DRAFT_161020 [Ramicandelaber brevisporus]|nr:hypothetical protein GQ42DRAFT_161020 [Ramicandelaber brevisporus]
MKKKKRNEVRISCPFIRDPPVAVQSTSSPTQPPPASAPAVTVPVLVPVTKMTVSRAGGLSSRNAFGLSPFSTRFATKEEIPTLIRPPLLTLRADLQDMMSSAADQRQQQQQQQQQQTQQHLTQQRLQTQQQSQHNEEKRIRLGRISAVVDNWMTHSSGDRARMIKQIYSQLLALLRVVPMDTSGTSIILNTIVQFPPGVLAYSITMIDYTLFRNVRISALLKYSTSKAESTIVSTREQFNHLTRTVERSILTAMLPAQRGSRILFWIRVARALFDLNNFQSLQAIVCALDATPIQRLSRSWSFVRSKDVKRLDKLRHIVSSELNHSAYRQALDDILQAVDASSRRPPSVSSSSSSGDGASTIIATTATSTTTTTAIPKMSTHLASVVMPMATGRISVPDRNGVSVEVSYPGSNSSNNKNNRNKRSRALSAEDSQRPSTARSDHHSSISSKPSGDDSSIVSAPVSSDSGNRDSHSDAPVISLNQLAGGASRNFTRPRLPLFGVIPCLTLFISDVLHFREVHKTRLPVPGTSAVGELPMPFGPDDTIIGGGRGAAVIPEPTHCAADGKMYPYDRFLRDLDRLRRAPVYPSSPPREYMERYGAYTHDFMPALSEAKPGRLPAGLSHAEEEALVASERLYQYIHQRPQKSSDLLISSIFNYMGPATRASSAVLPPSRRRGGLSEQQSTSSPQHQPQSQPSPSLSFSFRNFFGGHSQSSSSGSELKQIPSQTSLASTSAGWSDTASTAQSVTPTTSAPNGKKDTKRSYISSASITYGSLDPPAQWTRDHVTLVVNLAIHALLLAGWCPQLLVDHVSHSLEPSVPHPDFDDDTSSVYSNLTWYGAVAGPTGAVNTVDYSAALEHNEVDVLTMHPHPLSDEHYASQYIPAIPEGLSQKDELCHEDYTSELDPTVPEALSTVPRVPFPRLPPPSINPAAPAPIIAAAVAAPPPPPPAPAPASPLPPTPPLLSERRTHANSVESKPSTEHLSPLRTTFARNRGLSTSSGISQLPPAPNVPLPALPPHSRHGRTGSGFSAFHSAPNASPLGSSTSSADDIASGKNTMSVGVSSPLASVQGSMIGSSITCCASESFIATSAGERFPSAETFGTTATTLFGDHSQLDLLSTSALTTVHGMDSTGTSPGPNGRASIDELSGIAMPTFTPAKSDERRGGHFPLLSLTKPRSGIDSSSASNGPLSLFPFAWRKGDPADRSPSTQQTTPPAPAS